MKLNNTFRSLAAVAVLASFAACKPHIKEATPNSGTADFSRYIAIGNSLTSGYADGGLYLEGQKNSYPEMLAAQMKVEGGAEFYTPFFDEAQANGSGYLQLTGFSATGSPILTPVTSNLAITGTLPNGTPSYTKFTGAEINNYGVPGIKLKHVTTAGYGFANGYFGRFLPGSPDPASMTNYLDFVTAKPFTFFSLWLGNNDILLYASHGAVVVGDDSPTDKAVFGALYNQVVNRLTANGAKGVVATIPDVLSTPYFTTVTLAALQAAVAGRDLYIQTGAGATRKATADDRFILPLSSANVIGKPNAAGFPYGLHPLNPIASSFVLDDVEQAQVNDYVTSYNTIIKAAAASKGLAVFDANQTLKEFATEKVINGIKVSSAYIKGNLFSLDGIHLTPMGYAITANGFIQAINQTYGSNLSIVNVANFRSVKFPAGAAVPQ
ncbi:MAG: family lipolytic protein [Pedobacter sp.]|nr:family lipolytic protein [Pedobacter sp.]